MLKNKLKMIAKGVILEFIGSMAKHKSTIRLNTQKKREVVIMKKFIAMLILTVLTTALLAVPAFADGCGEWQLDSITSQYCSIQYICTTVGNPNPYLVQMNRRLKRVCVRANNTTYTDYSNDTITGACCRS